MKKIGLLGGTGWTSTIEYYRLINQFVNQKLGGHHSANLILKSIDYNDIMNLYGSKNHLEIANLLKKEILDFLKLNTDMLIICCNSLHKYFDIIKNEVSFTIPVMHAVELTIDYLKKQNINSILFLGTKFTMEDDFFKGALVQNGINVTIPTEMERRKIRDIHAQQLMLNKITTEAIIFFQKIIERHHSLDAVVLACSELNLVVNKQNSNLPIVDPIILQCKAAVQASLSK